MSGARTETPYLLYIRKNRWTSTMTGVLNLRHPGSAFEAEDGSPYAAVCEDHCFIVTGPTRRGMSEWASNPQTFCPECLVTFESRLTPKDA